jgi:hypothetical protein
VGAKLPQQLFIPNLRARLPLDRISSPVFSLIHIIRQNAAERESRDLNRRPTAFASGRVWGPHPEYGIHTGFRSEELGAKVSLNDSAKRHPDFPKFLKTRYFFERTAFPSLHTIAGTTLKSPRPALIF